MEQRERNRPTRFPAVISIFGDGPDSGNDGVRFEMGNLLETASNEVAERLSSNSARYYRSSGQQTGE